jgi:hypothetical protein
LSSFLEEQRSHYHKKIMTLLNQNSSEGTSADIPAALQEYQLQLKEKDQIIGQLQLENLALKGSLREGCQLLQALVHLLQLARISVPQSVALYLGHPIPRPMRVSASLPVSQMESAYLGRRE